VVVAGLLDLANHRKSHCHDRFLLSTKPSR
jgi:hypothetical protein